MARARAPKLRKRRMAGEEGPEEIREPLSVRARALGSEAVAALGYLVSGRAGPDPAVVARGGAFFPLLGLALGGVVVALLVAFGRRTGMEGALLAVLLSSAVSSARLPIGFAGAVALALSPRTNVAAGTPTSVGRILGVLAAGATSALKVWALSVTPSEAVGLSIPLAMMLGRWAFVVEAYGSQSARGEGLGAVFPRAMEFREFALASVSAMALTLILANAIGLVLILWTATQTIVARVFAHARAGGVGERSLLAAAELAEVSTLLLCAGLARAILAG